MRTLRYIVRFKSCFNKLLPAIFFCSYRSFIIIHPSKVLWYAFSHSSRLCHYCQWIFHIRCHSFPTLPFTRIYIRLHYFNSGFPIFWPRPESAAKRWWGSKWTKIFLHEIPVNIVNNIFPGLILYNITQNNKTCIPSHVHKS